MGGWGALPLPPEEYFNLHGRAHSAALLEAKPPAEGPRTGFDMTDTRRKESGHCVRLHLTHGDRDGRRTVPTHPTTHTHIQIPESSLVQMRAKHDRSEYKLSAKWSPTYSGKFGLTVTSTLKVEANGSGRVLTQPNGTGQGHVISGEVQSDSH